MSDTSVLPPRTLLTAPAVALIRAVDALRAQDAVELPGPQALLECSVLLAELDRLKALVLARLADVDLRGQQGSSLDRSDVALARRGVEATRQATGSCRR